MMEISNALHFYCSFLPCLMPSPCTTMHDHAPCSNCRKSHLWHALPSAKFTSFPRAAAGEALGYTKHPPLCSGTVGLSSHHGTKLCGSTEEQGLLACRLSLQPCRHKLLICSHLHRIAAADGASKLVAVADSYMPRVKYVSSTHHYFSCHHSCQFRPCLG